MTTVTGLTSACGSDQCRRDSGRHLAAPLGPPLAHTGGQLPADVSARADYAVVLLVGEEGDEQTVRVYDGSHGINELHRYTPRGGKQPAEVFHLGTLGEGTRYAIEQIETGYEAIIESWQTT